MDIHFRWAQHNGTWETLDSFYGTGDGTYAFDPPEENPWIWGNTVYIWSVNVTDGITWVNHTYAYTTEGSRYDVNNNGVVNFQDAGLVWVHRTTQAMYEGIYDVNNDGQVNFMDAGLTWINRD